MPSNFLSLDEFPTFTGQESLPQQITALHNYLFIMRQQLQYMLQNLSADNWNATALQSLTEESQAGLVGTLDGISQQLNQVKSSVDSLSGRLSAADGLSGRVTDAEADIVSLTAWTASHEDTTGDILDRMRQVEEDIADVQNQQADQDARLDDLDEQVAQTQTGLGDLDEQVNGAGGLEESLAALYQSVTALQESMTNLLLLIGQTDTGWRVGESGTQLNLMGDIYINGVLFMQETKQEETEDVTT